MSAKDSALARSVALMRLKARVPAAEVRTVPEASRLFLEVVTSEDRRVCLCVSAALSVGSLLDTVAVRLAVPNANATTVDDAKRLHLFAQSDTSSVRLLYGDRLATLVASGVITNGASLRLA